MKQIEVRLAVVLYGGVSLAVYIHGVTREILKFVRASKLFQAGARRTPAPGDSTAVYYELFRAVARLDSAWWSISFQALRPAASTASCWARRWRTICRWSRTAICG